MLLSLFIYVNFHVYQILCGRRSLRTMVRAPSPVRARRWQRCTLASPSLPSAFNRHQGRHAPHAVRYPHPRRLAARRGQGLLILAGWRRCLESSMMEVVIPLCHPELPRRLGIWPREPTLLSLYPYASPSSLRQVRKTH
jgi:hypothetical protein